MTNDEKRIELMDAMKNLEIDNDLWPQTELAFKIISGETYEGQEDDIEYILEGLKEDFDLFDVQDIICRDSWFFQDLQEWKDAINDL